MYKTIYKLRDDANNNQAIYGTSKYAANLLTLIKYVNVIIVNIIINIILTKAVRIILYLKNTVVHVKLRANCIKNIVSALQYGKHFSLFQTRKKEINNKVYSTLQTIPKTLLGGFHVLFKFYTTRSYNIYS